MVKISVQMLMVEDNLSDVRLMMKAFMDAKLVGEIHAVNDGVEALNFLRNKAPYQFKPRPNTILLDLNLPRLDGREFLYQLRQEPDLKDIPVIVFSTSNSRADREFCEKYGPVSYCVKPSSFDEYSVLVKEVERHAKQSPFEPASDCA